MLRVILSFLLAASVLFSACTPTAPVTPTTSAAATAAGLPPAPTPNAAETAAGLPATDVPAANALPPQGIVRFVDDAGRNDRVLAVLTNLPQPEAASEYELWLGDGTTWQSAGRFKPDAAGRAALGWSAPGAPNLVERFSAAQVTIEPQPDADPQPAPGQPLLRGGLTQGVLTHVRHVLVAFPATPGGIGFGLGLRQGAEQAARLAGLQTDAVHAGDLAALKSQAEQIVNLIEGSKGPDFGDLDHSGQVENGGDGFGLLQYGDLAGYLLATEDHARLAAEAPDSNDFVRQRAAEVKTAVANAREQLQALRDAELGVLQATTAAAAEPLVAAAVAAANRALRGADANADERIDPIPGEGGVLVAYARAQLMASIALSPDGTLPPAAATAAATPGTGVVVHMENFAFVPQVVTARPGDTIVWINDDSRNVPHTVTSKTPGAFDSGNLDKGGQFSMTFKEPGTYPYFCVIHGDFMSGTVVVQGVEPTP